MTSSDNGTDGGDPQGKLTTAGKLSGSPKLKFAQDASGDTITRNAGTWDSGDGFEIGQRITISGALNAGNYTITGISNGGKTLVLDTRESVDEIMTSALSIVVCEATPVQVSSFKSDSSAKTNGRTTDEPAEVAPVSSDDGPDASRRETNAPARAIRSATEIAEILQAICDEELALTAYPEKGELLFISRLRAVDPDLGRIIVDYGQWKPANSVLLDCESVLFHCERKKRHIQFLTESPTEIVFDGVAGIQVTFPQFVLDLQQRSHRRFHVKSQPSLWCVINREGSEPIVASVSDISRGGIGAFVHDPGVVVMPGTIFKNCQITGSSLKRPIDVSVEVRYWNTIHAQNGALSKRAGCRFVASTSDLQKLIDAFEADLDEDRPAD